MAMDLKVECHHCRAKSGEICLDTCEVNGPYLRQIKEIIRTKLKFKLILIPINEQQSLVDSGNLDPIYRPTLNADCCCDGNRVRG